MIGQIEICPNCGEPTTGGLFFSETEVSHCGCFWEGDPKKVNFHFSEDLIKTGDDPGTILPAGQPETVNHAVSAGAEQPDPKR